MGIFSLFGKKGAKQEDRSAEKSSAKKARPNGNTTVLGNSGNSDIFSHSVMAQRHIARATERKIDAIEFEMSRDIVKPRPSTTPASRLEELTTPTEPLEDKLAALAEFQSTLPMLMPTTDVLLGQHVDGAVATLEQSESVPVLEEAAILFASGQNQVTEQMLINAIRQQSGPAQQIAWHMLFDFYRITNNQHQFESLSLDYANQFETSPPLWPEHAGQAEQAPAQVDDATASITFPSKIDGDIVKLLEKLQQISSKSRSLRLDFARVKQVDAIGCGLLLRSLKNLKKSGHDLMLVAAQDFAEKIRAILQVGRRDETEAPWLLLLEILQLLHFEKAFEEASMDYCVTFEVSPPAFEAPQNKVTTSFPELKLPDEASDRFMMPAVIEGKTELLLGDIAFHASRHNPLILDCSRLNRVEFAASAQLMNGLVPIAGKKDMSIRFEEVNYLVMLLFNAMGLKSVASITPRKH